MPVPDLGRRRASHDRIRLAGRRALVHEIAERYRRIRKPRPGASGEAVAVNPDRPLDLSGGAAATLEFDA